MVILSIIEVIIMFNLIMNFFFTGKIGGMDLNLVMALTWDHGVRMSLQQTHHQVLAAMEGLPGN